MTKPVRAEYIGINELQTEANIEWKKDYVDRYGRTVSVDVTPIIPQVDKVPIQIVENQILPVENVLNIYSQSMIQEERDEESIVLNYLNQERSERGAVYICQKGGKLVLFEYDDLNTKIKRQRQNWKVSVEFNIVQMKSSGYIHILTDMILQFKTV